MLSHSKDSSDNSSVHSVFSEENNHPSISSCSGEGIDRLLEHLPYTVTAPCGLTRQSLESLSGVDGAETSEPAAIGQHSSKLRSRVGDVRRGGGIRRFIDDARIAAAATDLTGDLPSQISTAREVLQNEASPPTVASAEPANNRITEEEFTPTGSGNFARRFSGELNRARLLDQPRSMEPLRHNSLPPMEPSKSGSTNQSFRR